MQDSGHQVCVQALQKLLKSFGPDDLRVAQAYSNAASCLVGQNNMHEARAYLEKALQVPMRLAAQLLALFGTIKRMLIAQSVHLQ